MIVLTPGRSLAETNRPTILLFGAGLIGWAVAERLRRDGYLLATLPFSWSSAEQRQAETAGILDEVSALGASAGISILWSAGSAGFSASASTLSDEHSAFEDGLALAEKLSSSNQAVLFHLISSAGGLFEGQTYVAADAEPSPMRPYGRAKLAQEAAVLNRLGAAATTIYRPSSVFGYGRESARSGLVNALIMNTLRRRITPMAGGMNALRDYVLVDDIARFISAHVTCAESGKTHVLASGRPAATYEIVGMVARALGRQPQLHWVDSRTELSMSYAASVLPAGWRPTDLTTGIRTTAMRLRSRLEAVSLG